MVPFFLTLLVAPLLQTSQKEGDPLNILVLTQGEKEYTARAVLNQVSRHNPSLFTPIESDPSYRQQYLASPLFLSQVRAFANLKLLDDAGIPPVTADALNQEALAWDSTRSGSTSEKSILARHGIAVEVQARLLSQQTNEITIGELNQRLRNSVPEFFGEMQASIIRIPLFDFKTGHAMSHKQRKEIYSRLDKAAQAITSQKLTWEKAYLQYAKDPATKERHGRLNILKPIMPGKQEPEFLQQVFQGFGIHRPQFPVLKGPVLTLRWAYLIRLEGLNIRGVPQLNPVRDRVLRVLRVEAGQKMLDGLQQRVQQAVHAPILP
jgi:hypothetical protein